MEENRRNTIVKEIVYWKKNQMLPEQYCNYLLALYTEGGSTEATQNKVSSNKMLFPSIFSVILLLISIFVIYFTELSFTLQMTLVGTSCLIAAGLTYYYFKIGKTSHLSIIITAIILLLGTVEIGASYLQEYQALILYTVIFINCFIWVLAGRKLKLSYLIISGAVGSILTIGSIFI